MKRSDKWISVSAGLLFIVAGVSIVLDNFFVFGDRVRVTAVVVESERYASGGGTGNPDNLPWRYLATFSYYINGVQRTGSYITKTTYRNNPFPRGTAEVYVLESNPKDVVVKEKGSAIYGGVILTILGGLAVFASTKKLN